MLVVRSDLVALVYGLSEVALAVRKRSRRANAKSHDAGTLRLVWASIAVGFAGAIWIASTVYWGRFTLGPVQSAGVLACLIAGLALRWWAILVLGRFFTVDVAIHEKHELVMRGPYALVRHPSYTGALLAFAAIGFSFESWPGFAALLAPILLALAIRIRVEERALESVFGDAWRTYTARTWRLVPFVW
jgi:protein-S-isoprenylcysteine O-methyltransferase